MSTQQVTIERLGTQGDGIATSPAGVLYVPFSLPGETVAIARNGAQGTIMSISDPSPDRQTPPCRHFGPDGKNGTCGGCTLQHYADAPYRAYKRQIVVDALRTKGLAAEVTDLVAAFPGDRRRVVFAARQTEKAMLLGFNQMGSHHIVNIEECPIASPGIVDRLEVIRRIAQAIAVNAEAFRISVTETLSGLDIAAEGLKTLSDAKRRQVAQTVLQLSGIARVSINGEIVIEPQKPALSFGAVRVSPPPGAFTQATLRAEEAMGEMVTQAVGKAKRIADLFAGCGTFSLRLARIGQVHAVESEEKALAALDQAARAAQGLKPVSVERRDLFRRPLMAQELKKYDAVVFDPPRAGAEFQSRELAKSTVRKIVAVSCNPLTLARDLAILTEGGYRLKSVVPIDQFLWTAHVEAVAVLER